MPLQKLLDEKYTRMEPEKVLRLIAERKKQLGDDLCILCHHYQRDEVFRFADFTGDSLKLSQQAAGTGAKYIVFCGVRFMAESADILTGDDCAVILPDLDAGCEMADLAEANDVSAALNRISDATGGAVVAPITYVNSSASVKAVTGSAGGACCTSSNARNVFEWVLRPKDKGGAGGAKILAAPDQHLARNTAIAMGYGLADCVMYDPAAPKGGLSDEQIRDATFILWKGHCYVHQVFSVEQIGRIRQERPGIKVIVHPECPREVVAAADLAGSTERILRAVTDSPAGSAWAVGTEANMVRRLATDNPDKFVHLLSDAAACTSMSRIDPPHLLWVLDNLAEGRVVNRISVPEDVAADARIALERMISIRTG